ncbi:hypothetical protein AVEN_22273-1 [Araneus ventricosus]|uniref:Uncharacterized protein n=1 Tax=Araneus ventricosus TaxID=182803 RepID=A0A4Y2HTY8_ARAVE|nr:hypothetical protein AVEN_22273-1 [Araneus ventricosus]
MSSVIRNCLFFFPATQSSTFYMKNPSGKTIGPDAKTRLSWRKEWIVKKDFDPCWGGQLIKRFLSKNLITLEGKSGLAKNFDPCWGTSYKKRFLSEKLDITEGKSGLIKRDLDSCWGTSYKMISFGKLIILEGKSDW